MRCSDGPAYIWLQMVALQFSTHGQACWQFHQVSRKTETISWEMDEIDPVAKLAKPELGWQNEAECDKNEEQFDAFS